MKTFKTEWDVHEYYSKKFEELLTQKPYPHLRFNKLNEEYIKTLKKFMPKELEGFVRVPEFVMVSIFGKENLND